MKLALLLALLAPQAVQDPAVELNVGGDAPKFQIPDASGKPWKSEDYLGKKIVVLYFFPAAFTSGCTAQARAYQADQKKFAEMGVDVIGVSGDTVQGQAAFKKAHKFDFNLLADDKGTVAKLFGVPVKPGGTVSYTLEGKEEKFTRGVTPERWTFVIDQTGKIAYKNTKVNPGQDSKAVLEVIQKLK